MLDFESRNHAMPRAVQGQAKKEIGWRPFFRNFMVGREGVFFFFY